VQNLPIFSTTNQRGEDDMKRRTFLKSIAASGVAASVAGSTNFMLPRKANAAKKIDIGEVKSVKVDVLTETSWFNNDVFKKNIMDYGGGMTNQYTIPWEWDNAGGYSALITVTTLEAMREPS
jgi:7,8-dihydropterin-6-yl-methyl-4-(beta-D-ribofuranosyl)aminobenzene 5'-phosphate synthase